MKNSQNKQDIREKEANYFARALLMPSSFIKDEVSKLLPNDTNPIKTLSDIFNVDEIMMCFRLAELGYDYGMA